MRFRQAARAGSMALAMGLFLLGPARGNDAAPASNGDFATQRKDADWALEGIRRLSWALIGATTSYSVDRRHRTIADDVDDWIMPGDLRGRIQSNLANSDTEYKAGHLDRANELLEVAMRDLESQWYVVNQIMYYWTQRIELDWEAIELNSWAKNAAPEIVNPGLQSVNAGEDALAKSFSPSLSWSDLVSRIQELKETYNRERLAFASSASMRLWKEKRAVALSRYRRAPCIAVPEQDWFGLGEAALLGDLPPKIVRHIDTEIFYPIDARRNQVTGVIFAHIFVEADGCVSKEEVIGSSGSFALDSAALDVVDYMGFRPAFKDGKPVPSWAALPVSFTLSDTEPQSGQPPKMPN